MSRLIDPQQAAHQLDRYFNRIQEKKLSRPLQVRVYSEELGLHYAYPLDSTRQPYHIASIGKVFTAVLVLRLAERGVLSIKDPLSRYLPPATLERLFVFQNKDYAQEATIEQLLAHTSGVADYFEEKTFQKGILSNPQRRWTPEDLLDFTREHQTAVGAPGQVFNYSDTGYILLGFLIEKVTGKSFAHHLAEDIFMPLQMDDSYLMFFSEPLNTPKKAIEKIWFNNVEISDYESLSCDWAGGGIVSTTADLLKFNQALRSGKLLQNSTLERMDDCQRKFRPGIYYGTGMMEIRFKEFFFLLGRLPKVRGHIGILATHLFYDPSRSAQIILNYGDNTRMVESFKALIQVENILQKMQSTIDPA